MVALAPYSARVDRIQTLASRVHFHMGQSIKHLLTAPCVEELSRLVVLDDAAHGLVGDVQIAVLIGGETQGLS